MPRNRKLASDSLGGVPAAGEGVALRDARRHPLQVPTTEFGEEPGLPSTAGGRVRVPINKSADFPFRTIGNVNSFCSATLVGPCHYLTNGHCVFTPLGRRAEPGDGFNPGGKYDPRVNFNPGRNGAVLREPLGRFQPLQVYPSIQWALFANSTADAAIVQVEGRPGDELG